MNGYWITPAGQYYEGEPASPADQAVPQRPDATYGWVNGAWKRAGDAVSQATLCDAVDTYRDGLYQAGFVDAATGKTWQLRPGTDDKTNWTVMASNAQPWALGLITANAPSFKPIPATNETDLVYTPAQIYGLIAQRMMPAYEAIWFYARNMKNAIAAGNPPADITAGWPAFSA